MRDPLLMVIKKDDVKKMTKPDIDEVAKEVLADDDCSSVSSQGLREISPNTPELNTRRPEASSITKTRNIRESTKIIESTRNEAGLKVPKENFIKLTPEKSESIHKDTVPKPYNTEIIESVDYLIITLKASHRQKIPKLRTSATKSVSKSSKSSAQVPKVNPKVSVLLSGNVAALPTAFPIQQHTATKDYQSSKTPEAVSITVSPIVLHGVAKASEKYVDTPNEDFYAELRDYNRPTRWNNSSREHECSKTSVPHSSSKLYPTEFATFLIRVPVPKPIKELHEAVLNTNTIRSVKYEEKLIGSPKTIDFNKRRDVLPCKGYETPLESSIMPSSVSQNLDPFTVNPIKFRKELRALCRSKSHDESIMGRKKESERFVKSGAIPKSPTSLKVKKVKKSSLTSESGEVFESRETRRRKREALQIGSLPETIDLNTGTEIDWTKKRASPVPCELQFSETDFEKVSFQTGALSEAGAVPESDALSEAGALPLSDALSKVGALPEIGALSETGTLPETGDIPDTGTFPEKDALPETGALPETRALPETDVALPETDVALPETRKKCKVIPKNMQATDTKIFQFRDIPVVAYVSRSTTNQRNTNLKNHLKNKDPLGYHYKKFKYYKRYESSRQQNLLGKIVFDLPQIDAAMFDAQMLTFRIETLRRENCETEEGLRNRNLGMKWLMSRLVRKTMKIDFLFQSIRCYITMYTLETNASNSKANKRLDKVLKLFFEAEEFTQILRENLVLL